MMNYTFASATILLILITDPVGNIPIFANALKHVAPERRARVILREILIAFFLLLTFMFVGEGFLKVMNLSELSLQIGGGNKARAASLLEIGSEFSAGGGLTRALQTAEHDDGGRRLNEKEPTVFAAHELDEFIVHDGDKFLPRLHALGHFATNSFQHHRIAKVLRDLLFDIGFKQRGANFFERFANIRLADRAAARERAKGG